MSITVYNEVGWASPLSTYELTHLLRFMLLSCGLENFSVDLYVVRDGTMANANQGHMHCQGPTNVLSFPVEPGDFVSQDANLAMPSTLIFSTDTWKRECLLYGQSPMVHFVRLLAHGLAHLQGYDHGPEMDVICAHMERVGVEHLAAWAWGELG